MGEYVSYRDIGCFPGKSQETSDYCSQIDGHEYENPNGISACHEENKYCKPRAQ